MAEKKRRTAEGIYKALNQIASEEGVDFGLNGVTEDQFKQKYFSRPDDIGALYDVVNGVSDQEDIDFGQGTREEWLESFGPAAYPYSWENQSMMPADQAERHVQQAYHPKPGERQNIDVLDSEGNVARYDTAQNVNGKIGVIELEPVQYTPSSTRSHYDVTKESAEDIFTVTPNERGEIRFGWQRGQRVRKLDKNGIWLMGNTGGYDNDFFRQAEKDAAGMSDEQLVATFNNLSREIINKEGLASTVDGYQLASTLKAYGRELRARDVGLNHGTDIHDGDYHYHAAMMEPGMSQEISKQEAMSWEDRLAYLNELLKGKQAADMTGQMGLGSAGDQARTAMYDQALMAATMIHARERGILPEQAYSEIVGAVQNNIPTETGIWAGFKQSIRQMGYDIQHFWGEVANVVAGSRGDITDAMRALDKYGQDADTIVLGLATYNFMKNMPIIGEPLKALFGDADLPDGDINVGHVATLLHSVLEETKDKDGHYNVAAANKMLERMLKQAGFSYGDTQIRSSAYNTAYNPIAEGNGAWVGQNLAQMIPSGTAIVVGIATKSPTIASVIGNLGMGAMTLSSAGSAMREARQYGASDAQVWATGIANGFWEWATEKIPFDRYTKRVFGSVRASVAQRMMEAVGDSNSAAAHELNALLKAVKKDLGGSTKDLLKAYTGDVLAEGSSEFAAGALQKMCEMIYKNPEDYPTLMEILNDGWEGAKGGVFMGAGMGVLSIGTASAQTDARRRNAGYVSVATYEDEDGNTELVEVLGRGQDGRISIIRGNEVESVDESNISNQFTFSYQEWKKGEVQHQQDAAFEEGHEAVEPEERRAAKDRLDVARARLEQKGYSEQWMQWLDNAPAEDVMNDLTERGLAGDTDAVMEYLNAKSAYDGMLQRVNDDIDDEVAVANEAIDQRIAPEDQGGDGMIHPAVLKGGREVFIISGNVATLADNSIDVENSDGMIIVRDAEGNEDTISPDNIQSLGEVIDPAQQRQDAEQMIIDEQGQAAAAQIEGQLPFNVGDQYTISYQGEPHTYQVVQADENNVAVLVDGSQEPVVLTKQQLQQMADEEHAEQIQAQAAAADAVEEEPAAVEPEQPVEAPAVEETPAAPVAPEDNPTAAMPMDDQGEPAWDQVEPERGHQFLYQESGWPQAMADNFVQDRIDEAEKALTKAQEAGQKLVYNPKPTFSAQQQAVAENTAAQQAAQSALDYWNGVQGIQTQATAPVVETPAEQEPTEQAAPVAETEEPAAPVEPVEETPAVEEEQPEQPVETPAPVADNEMQPVEVEQPAEAATEEAPQSDAIPEQPAEENDNEGAPVAEAPADETAPAQSDDMDMPNTLPGNHIELNYESGKDAESRAYIEEVMEREGWDEEAKSEFRKILDDAADLVSRMAQGFTRLREWNNKKLTDEQGNYNPLWRVWDNAVGWIPNRSSFKKNGEYPYNIDLGALCTKREAFDAVVRYIKEQGWGQNLGPTQIEALKSLLREHGFLTACDICFNETKRARALDYGNAVAYYWNAVRQAVGITDNLPIGTPRELTEEQMKILTALAASKNGKAFSKYIPKAVRRTYETYTNTKGERKTREADKGLTPTMTAKVAKLFLQDPSLMGRFEGTTLLSTDSVDALVRQHPQTDIAEFIAGAWGSATPKPNEGFNIYDPLSWKQAYDKKRQRPAMDWFFNLGGFRAQSFSDYHPIFFYDYVQMFTDLAIRRLPIHIYTKVPALIKLFGGTGAKFNMSLVPEVVQGVDAEHLGLKPDGNGGWELAWHEDSFPVDEAFALRQDPRFNGNVGTIAVGISDAHIRMLLDDPRIDMVIPYHKSGMPKSVQIKTGLNNATDYTADQQTKGKKKGLKDFSFNEALRRLGDPRKAADEYLAWCKQNKCTPKFPQFADHPNYYKVLEDFRCIDNEGNYSPQQPVQVSFFDDVEQRLSESLEDRTMQEGLDTAIRGNDAITEGIKKIMSKPRLDGKIRDMMLARLKQVLGKDNVASLKQEDFFEELQKVYTDQMGAERAQQQVEVLRTSGGIVYGFAVGDRIVLNENYFNAETPMHEFTHVWVKVARLANPQMWADGKELLKQTKEWQEVMSDEFYRDIQGDEDAVASEVLARIVGQDAARQINEMFAPEDKPQERPGIYNKIKQWVNKFLDGVRSLFSDNAKGLTYDELVRMPMKALFDDAESARFMEALQQVNEEDVDLSSQGSVPTFYSNAAKAVENVKQNKATAEQWKAMLTKQGGIKAGEDKWMGLSTWLDEHKGETLTKDEVLQFVMDNGIKMEEVHYGEAATKEAFNDFNDEFLDRANNIDADIRQTENLYESHMQRMRAKYGEDYHDKMDSGEAYEERIYKEGLEMLRNDDRFKVAFDLMVQEYGDDFGIAFNWSENGLEIVNEEAASFYLNGNPVNSTRLLYTTEGLENKSEIAFELPDVLPYQEEDEIHFGPENGGRAVMWVRYGEARDADSNRVLVIDEIQSNRHQNAREKGYRDTDEISIVEAKRSIVDDRMKELYDTFYQRAFDKDPYKIKTAVDYVFERRGWEAYATDDEALEYKKLEKERSALNGRLYELNLAVPAAPFEKNWHEVAMKRMLRLAAEEGFDKVAWTTGMQQAERYSIGKVIDSIHRTQTFNTGETRFDLMPRNDSGSISLFVKDGVVTRSARDELADKPLEDVVGKEVAQKMLGMSDHSSIDIADMDIGGEGMKSFYDKMLPQFMNKYGKRWGVKVGEVTLDTPGKEVMHSVDVTPEMRRSVMTEGQPLFQIKSLGAPYQGSKSQIATRIVDALPSGKRFVDLFSGGGAVTHAAMLSGKYEGYRMNDINPAGQELFLAGMRGDYRDYQPRELTAEEFKAIKGTPEGLLLSYSGLGRNVDSDKESVARRLRRVQRLEELKPYADQVESSNTDYREVQLQPGDVVYADIPYEGTNKTGYREGAKFDKQAFSDWALGQDVPIYVSEQSMPEGWVEVQSWNMKAMRGKTRGEKLFVQAKFAGDGGNATAHGTDQTKSANFKRWFGDWENDPENSSKVVDDQGRPLVVYHQTNAKRWINRETGEDWEKLDWRKKMEWENKSQEEWEDAWEEQDFYTFDDRYARQSIEMPAIFFSPENDPHHEYGNRTIAVYLNMRNPAINPDIPNRGVTDTAGRDAMEALKAQGYDGFIRTDEDGNIREYGVFDSNQVKSADEVTFDDEGNEIPEEERYNPDEQDIRYRELDEDEDAELIDRLENGPHITTYSTKIKVDDGYVPPMSSKDNETGEMRAPEHEQKWNESEERPDLAKQDKKTGKWKFDLKKSNDKDVNGVLYNPYNHSGSGMLNDQFSEAQDRDDLVVVEQVVPQSEETDKYKAEKANDPTGWKAWKAGPITAKMTGKRKVFLSRWHKITRVVPWSEVADAVAKDLGNQFDVLPTNPFPPQLRAELEKKGYKFVKTDNKCVIQEGEYKGATWSERYYDVYPDRAKSKDKREKGARAKAVKEQNTSEASRMRSILEDGGTLRVYQSEGKWRVEGVPGEFNTQFGAVDNARNFLQGHVFEVAEDGNSIEVLGAGSNLDNMLGTDTAAEQRPTQQATAKQRKAEERARKWRERTIANGRRRVEELGQRLGVKVTIVDDMSEQERDGMSKKKRRAKGWYDVRTGEVFINLGNHKTVSDIEATFLHEVVAHKGLRRLFGEEFNTFLHNVYYNVDSSIREEINRLMAKNNWDYREATEEYLAKLAQQMNFERAEKYVKAWETVKRLFNSLLQNVGLGNGMNLKDSDLRGILFESYHNMEKEGVAGLAESTAFRDWMEREANRRVDNATNETAPVAAEGETRYNDPRTDLINKVQSLVDDFSRKYNTYHTHVVMSDDAAAIRAIPAFDYEFADIEDAAEREQAIQDELDNIKDEKDNSAITLKKSGEIIIFADRVKTAEEVEKSCFHEGTHSWLRRQFGYNTPRSICENFWNATEKRFPKAHLKLKAAYPKNTAEEQHEEFFVYALTDALIRGSFEKVDPYLNELDRHYVDKILKELGYDRQRESQERSGREGISESIPRLQSEETTTPGRSDEGGRGGSEEGRVTDEDARFRDDDDTIDDYNHEVNTLGRVINVAGRDVKPRMTRFNFQEAFQDAILSVKKLQQVVCKKYGLKSLPSKEDAWTYENRLQSINMRERKHFINEIYEKMMKVHDKLIKNGATVDEINEYVICKHGLERNKVFAQRDANAEANEIARNGGVPDMQQLLDKYRQRDYSGLTAITGLYDIADIEAEAQRRVDAFEQKHGTLCNELWGRINDATKWTLRRSYECGMMSAQTYIKVRDMFQWYVPLRGFNETTAEDVYDYMMGDRGAFNGTLRTAEGRTSLADDPFATIGNMGESAIVQGNRNKLKQRLWNMATQHPTDVCQVRDMWVVQDAQGNWIADFPDIPEDADADTIAQILEDHETAMTDLENQGLAKRVRNDLDIGYRIDQRNVPEHAVVVMMNGDRHVVYINGNPRAAQAINGNLSSDKGSKNAIRKLIDFIFKDTRRYYSSVITSYNINFSGANFVRDLPHAYAMTFTKYGFARATKYIAKSFQCIPWVIKNQFGVSGNSRMDQLFHEFVNYGGVTGYAHINDVDAWKADNRRRLARLNALGRATVGTTKAIKAVIEAIGWFSETLELIPRFTTYCASRDAGMDIQQSIKEAKDITTNFNKKGTEMTPGVWGAVANTLRYTKMFFNPIVQGMYQWFDVAKDSKAAKARLAGLMLWMPAMGAMIPYLNQFLLAALGGDDDDDYFLQNEFTRRQNMLIFTGKGYVKIPIAPVFRELYGMGETVATRACGRIDDLKMATDFVDQLRTVFSLEGQSNYREWSIARAVAPEQYAPIVDIMNNENFTGKQLWYESDWTKSKPEYTKAKESTWSPLVNISRTINEWLGGDEDIKADQSGKWLNPVVWQHLITNYGGGFAQVLGDVTSSVNNMLEGKSTDVSQWPIAKRFYTEPTAERANWARYGLFKQYETEYNKAKDKYAALKKRGVSAMEMAKEIDNFAQRHPRAASIYAAWNGGIKGADYVQRMKKLREEGNDDEYWALVKEAVGKADGAMRKGYAKAWEEERVDRPESMSDDELYKRFDDARTDSLRAIYSREIATRNGIRDALGKAPSSNWKEETKAYWETYKELRKSSDILEDAKAAKILDDDEKKYLKEIRQGLGQGDDDDAIMEEHRQERQRMLKEHGEQ